MGGEFVFYMVKLCSFQGNAVTKNRQRNDTFPAGLLLFYIYFSRRFFTKSPSFMITSICSAAMVLISSSGLPSMTSRSALLPSSRDSCNISHTKGSCTVDGSGHNGIHLADSRFLYECVQFPDRRLSIRRHLRVKRI